MTAALLASVMRGTASGNKLRVALTIACIALGVALAGAVHTLHSSALAEIGQAARTLSGRADVEVRGPRSGFDDALFERLADRPEVRAASPVLELDAALGPERSLRILGIDALRAVRLQPAFVSSAQATGAGSAPSLLDASALWLAPAAAARLALAPGDRVEVLAGAQRVALRVAGVLPGLAAAGDVAVTDIATAQEKFGALGRITRIDIALRPGVRAEAFIADIRSSLPAGVEASAAGAAAGRAGALTRAYRVNLDALALVALVTGAFLVFSTLALQATRRRQELALLRALGVTRRGMLGLLAAEGALLGITGALLGTALAVLASRYLLGRVGADLGAGYFAGRGSTFAADPVTLAAIALLAVAMSVAAAAWIGRGMARMDVAQALRDRQGDLPEGARGSVRMAAALALAGVPLLHVPAIGGLPLAGYAALALWLAASVVIVGPLARAALVTTRLERHPLAALAVAQVRALPGQLAASIAGVVVSASLAVAMAIMVFSFRQSLEDWLQGVVGADLYVRAGAGETAYFPPDVVAAVGRVPGVAGVEPLRYDRITTAEGHLATIVARPIDERILAGFQASPATLPTAGGEPPVWISEAAADLHGWRAGDRIALPLAGRATEVRVAGIVRDYARTWGAILVPIEDYRRITGDARANDLAIHLAPGASGDAVRRAIRALLPEAAGVAFEDAAGIRARSLEIFDRTFAVTYALEAIAIAIGLAGITSSFAALAWSRRREFAMLRFVGLRRRDVLRLLALEGSAAGMLGAAIGLAAGAAMSLVLVHVINRQSFHWGMEIHWPVASLAIFTAALVALCAGGARASGALAVRDEAVRAIKDDA